MATPATGATVVQVTRVEDGGVRGSLLRPGRWSLVVDWASTSIVREFEVTGDAEVDVGDVAIPPRVMLEGVVLRSDGRPCGGATVAFCDVATQSPGAAVSVREDGRFALELTDAARGALLVRKRGLGAAVVPLGDPSKPVTVRLAAEGTLDVRIVPPPGSSGSWSWRVETSDGTVKWQPEAEFRPGVTTGERRVVCGGVAAGPVTFVVEGSGWRFERAVVIVPGETVTATLGPDR
jgi:hypothetical protein